MKFKRIIIVLLMCCFLVSAASAGWRDKLKQFLKEQELSEEKIVEGLKEALKVGTQKAVEKTGIKDGYFGNEKIKIPMPEKMQKVDKMMRKLGMDREMDRFLESMNRAAEAAAPEALSIFKNAVKEMTISDARGILKGGDHAATEFFSTKTRSALSELFKPIVTNKLEQVGSTKKFNRIIKKYNRLPLVKPTSFTLENYVTEEALDGLFYMVGKEEEKIRKDPKARVTEILKEVFSNRS